MKNKIFNIVSALGTVFLVILTFDAIFILIFGDYGPIPKFSKDVNGIEMLIMGCIIAPFSEEFIFRYLPHKLLENTQIFKENKYVIFVIIGIFFGWLHGSYFNVFVQGVAGIGFGYVYLRNNNSYWSAVVMHSLYNFLVGVIIPLIF